MDTTQKLARLLCDNVCLQCSDTTPPLDVSPSDVGHVVNLFLTSVVASVGASLPANVVGLLQDLADGAATVKDEG